MRIYLSGRYERRKELKGYAEKLVERGCEVTSRWHECEDEEENHQNAQAGALMDIEDVRSSDMLIAFTDLPGNTQRGGRHVEFGLAMAEGKRLMVVGPPENVFHYIPQVTRCLDWPAALWELERHL